MRIVTMALVLTFTTAAFAQAADAPTAHATDHAVAANELPYPHPVLPPHPAAWSGVVLIVVLGMFLAAATIGPIVRANMPEEVPDSHSHDEHGHGEHDKTHGHGHGHGHGHH